MYAASWIGSILYFFEILSTVSFSLTLWNLLGTTNLLPIINSLEPVVIAFAILNSFTEKPYLNAIELKSSFAFTVWIVGVFP